MHTDFKKVCSSASWLGILFFFLSKIQAMWYSKEYDPIQVGSMDGNDTKPHDKAIKRAMTCCCKF